jgi:DNA repair ATPase RecN
MLMLKKAGNEQARRKKRVIDEEFARAEAEMVACMARSEEAARTIDVKAHETLAASLRAAEALLSEVCEGHESRVRNVQALTEQLLQELVAAAEELRTSLNQAALSPEELSAVNQEIARQVQLVQTELTAAAAAASAQIAAFM